MPVTKHRISRDDNEFVKRGETPAAWEEKPAKNRQKDKDARWTKKHGKSFFGYKNHVNADKAHKLMRDYEATDAAVIDSRELEDAAGRGQHQQRRVQRQRLVLGRCKEQLAARGRSCICIRRAASAGGKLNKASKGELRLPHLRTVGIVSRAPMMGMLENCVRITRRVAHRRGCRITRPLSSTIPSWSRA